MRTFRKAFVLLTAVLLCLVMAAPALAQSRIVSNVIVVMPPSHPIIVPEAPVVEPEETVEPETTEVPGEIVVPEETVDPEETEIPEEIVVPEETVDPEATEDPEETVEPEETAIFEEDNGMPEGAEVSIHANVRQQGDEPAYGDQIRLDSTLVGLDDYELELQWQQFKNGEWFDVADATGRSFTFVRTEENANDSWRLHVVVHPKAV